jgi:hypothetical protein
MHNNAIKFPPCARRTLAARRDEVPSWYTVYILLGLLGLCSAASAESWMQTTENGDPVECPDVIEIDDGQYRVLNDCYGMDTQRPIIETGKYSCGAGKITFSTESDLEESISDYGRPRSYVLRKEGNLVILGTNSEALFFLVLSKDSDC